MSQNKLLIRKEDDLEFEASLLIDRGRLKFIKPGRFQFYTRGKGKPIRKNDMLSALQSYTLQENQPDKCMNCSYGMLVDIQKSNNGPSRTTGCLQGVADYKFCSIDLRTNNATSGDSCVNAKWKGKKCHHVL